MGSMAKSDIEDRKADHLEVVASGRADFRDQGTLLDAVRLAHQSLPEMELQDVDLSVSLFGKTLKAPLVITGMTGGTDRARDINRDLARAAQEVGVAFGVGSQRAMAEKPELSATYQVRDAAPDLVLVGNIGAVQAVHYGTSRIAELAADIGADAMAVHLNPAQELIQREGDRDFRRVLKLIGKLCADSSVPVVVKETGCGLSAQSARALKKAGVRCVDVSGAGGTSWVAVERHRAFEQSQEQRLGDELWDWGVPTAVSVHLCAREELSVIASGGIRSGLDIARAIALGATAGGLAAPVLQAHCEGGYEAVLRYLQGLVHSLRCIHLLTGCRTPGELQSAAKHISEPLRSWIHDLQ